MDRICVFLSITFLLTSLSIVSCDVISMGTMINWEDKSTNSIFDVLSRFNGYGCYCGFGGQGTPLDEIDYCCQVHDECYDELAKEGICSSGHAGVGMVYKYTKIDNNGQHTVECKPSADSCAEKVCDCDKALADCFSSNESSYNEAHRNYNRKRFCSEK